MTPPAASFAAALASAIRACGTSIRLGAVQVWPELPIIATVPLATDLVNAESSSTILGLLPPSSCATRLTVSAAFFAIAMPARVEPVKLTMSISGWPLIASPTPGPSPLTRLNTPAGTPAACMISAKIQALKGAISLGLSTMVLPVASAGKTLQAIWLSGQFHGVIMPTTPTGSHTCKVGPSSRSNAKPSSTSMAFWQWPASRPTCGPLARLSGAPISSLTAVASSSLRVSISAWIARSRVSRSSLLVWLKPSNALRAATTALSTSAAVPKLIWPMVCSVAGFSTATVFSSTGSTHWPSM